MKKGYNRQDLPANKLQDISCGFFCVRFARCSISNGFPENISAFDAKLQLLKDKGLQINQTQGGANTLLHIAAQKNNIALLKNVIDLGVDINAVNSDGYSALHISAIS